MARGSKRILAAFEISGKVRDAFAALGHEAWSCDLQASDHPRHRQCNALDEIERGWDLVIAFPPCTHLASSGARWFAEKRRDGRQQLGIDLFMDTVELCSRHARAWAVENPVGIMSTVYRKPDQIIQPWQFGHGETKATCLWLGNLPKLQPTRVVKGRKPRIHFMPPSGDRAKKRSETYTGIARAMAKQWGEI
jgi:hypothetical protein